MVFRFGLASARDDGRHRQQHEEQHLDVAFSSSIFRWPLKKSKNTKRWKFINIRYFWYRVARVSSLTVSRANDQTVPTFTFLTLSVRQYYNILSFGILLLCRWRARVKRIVRNGRPDLTQINLVHCTHSRNPVGGSLHPVRESTML